MDKHDIKTVYNITRQLAGRNINTSKPVKDKSGNNISQLEKQLERWKEHFCELLNGQEIQEPSDIISGDDLQIETDIVTMEEIINADKKIKTGKAPGPDHIPPEVLKISPETTADILYDLFKTIWENEEIPEEWRLVYISKLAKKDDLSNCQNCRGIQLLSLPSQVLTRVILERIKHAVDECLRDEQTGFRCGRSCADLIATIRVIIEQSLEWQSTLYIYFVDFRKAFDMVDRYTVWRILRHYGIPEKIVNIMQSLYDNTKCQVIHNSSLSKPFKVVRGVRQGCMLFPVIFTLVIDWIMKTSMNPPRGLQWTLTSKLEDLDFADDVSLLSHQLQQMQQKTESLYQTARQSTGLEINTDKSKSLRINTQQDGPITLNDKNIEDVDHFTYLGSIVTTSGGADEDIRVRKGQTGIRHLKTCLAEQEHQPEDQTQDI